MRYVPVGSQIYAYVQRMDAKENLPLIFSDVAAAGYEGIELFASIIEEPADVEHARALSVEFSLPVIAAYYSAPLGDAARHESIVAEVERAGANLQSLGGEFLLFGNHHQPTLRPADPSLQAKTLEDCATVAREHGLTLAYHTYAPDLADGERQLNELFARVGDRLALAPDLNWIARAGADPADFLRRWQDHVRYIHLRDEKAGRWVESLGEGDVDFRALRDVIDEIEFEGWLIAELANEPDATLARPIGDSLRRSREHLRETMGF